MSHQPGSQNGRKRVLQVETEPPNGCRHAADCDLAQSQRDVAAQLVSLADTVGEAFGRLEDQVRGLALHLSDVAERQVVASQREEQWMSQLRTVRRDVARETVEAVRLEVDRLVGTMVAAELRRLREQEIT